MMMINNCDDDEYDDCEGYKTDDIDYHVGSDYFVGRLTLYFLFIVVVTILFIFC
jgi:hypothetical protein